jgi:hypothetical protein
LKKGECVHFTGGQNTLCDAGLNMREVTGPPDEGWFLRCPCHDTSSWRTLPEGWVRSTCEKYTDPTDEQLADFEKEIQAEEDKFTKVVPIIGEIKKNHPNGGSGKFECPACKDGQVSWIMSKSNGHTHGKCSTLNCIGWHE